MPSISGGTEKYLFAASPPGGLIWCWSRIKRLQRGNGFNFFKNAPNLHGGGQLNRLAILAISISANQAGKRSFKEP
jgi:hypothetical protein